MNCPATKPSPRRTVTRTRRGRVAAPTPCRSATRTRRRLPSGRSSTVSIKPVMVAMTMRPSTGASTIARAKTPGGKSGEHHREPDDTSPEPPACSGTRLQGRRTRPLPARGAHKAGFASAWKNSRMPAPKHTASQGNSRRCSTSRANPRDSQPCQSTRLMSKVGCKPARPCESLRDAAAPASILAIVGGLHRFGLTSGGFTW